MTDNREQELEILKIDLDNLITGMAVCKSILTNGERDCLEVLIRCKSILDRITPISRKGEE